MSNDNSTVVGSVRLPSTFVSASVLLAVAYLLGYWRTFGIDPFEFVEFTDVIKLAFSPLFIASLPSLLIFLIRRYQRLGISDSELASTQANDFRDIGIPVFLAMLAGAGLVFSPILGLAVGGPALGILITILLQRSARLRNDAKTFEIGYIVGLLIALTVLAFVWGKVSAISVAYSKDPKMIDMSRSELQKPGLVSSVRYLGKLGPNILGWERKRDTVVVLNPESKGPLYLTNMGSDDDWWLTMNPFGILPFNKHNFLSVGSQAE